MGKNIVQNIGRGNAVGLTEQKLEKLKPLFAKMTGTEREIILKERELASTTGQFVSTLFDIPLSDREKWRALDLETAKQTIVMAFRALGLETLEGKNLDPNLGLFGGGLRQRLRESENPMERALGRVAGRVSMLRSSPKPGNGELEPDEPDPVVIDPDEIEAERKKLEAERKAFEAERKKFEAERKRFEDDLAKAKRVPAFPEIPLNDPKRRQTNLRLKIADAPVKTYEKREISVRTSAGAIDPTTRLRKTYTNMDGQMVCQLCRDEMPFKFKRKQGIRKEHYFEAVEIFKEQYLPKELEAQYLALCPSCAAKYKNFVKNDEAAMNALRDAILNAEVEDGFEAPITLDQPAAIRFVATHLFDLQTILQAIRDEKG